MIAGWVLLHDLAALNQFGALKAAVLAHLPAPARVCQTFHLRSVHAVPHDGLKKRKLARSLYHNLVAIKLEGVGSGFFFLHREKRSRD